MKRLFFVFSSIALVFLVTAFSPKQLQQETKESTNPAVYKLMEVTFLWELLKDGYEPDRDRDDTWLNVGFRSKYAMAKKYASLEMVETAFGVPVFLEGPHDGDMNFNSKDSFGHYNPDFVSSLQTNVKEAFKNTTFRKAMKYIYREHLEGMARTYHDAYSFLNNDAAYLEELQLRYLELMESQDGIEEGSFQEEFRDYAEDLEKNKQGDVYEGFTAPAFWLRRSIDGTDALLFEFLDMVVKEMEKE